MESSLIGNDEKSSLHAILPNGSFVSVIVNPLFSVPLKLSKLGDEESHSSRNTTINSVSHLMSTINPEVRNHYTNTAQNVNEPLNHTHNQNIHNKDDVALTVKEALCDDGNLPYCTICLEYGEIVCCDGCPKVYHAQCIPKQSESRTNLDNDVDPWFCPDCLSASMNSDLNEPNETSKYKSMKPAHVPLNHGNHRAVKEIGKLTSVESFQMKRKTFDPSMRKKRKSSMDSESDRNDSKQRVYEMNEGGLVKIFPPFHYYLLDHRERIERMIERRKRSSDDSSKSKLDHNYVVAKEAMNLWRRASDRERQRYIAHSLDEFEQNIIQWKRDRSNEETVNKTDQNNSQILKTPSTDNQFWRHTFNSLISGVKVRCDRSKLVANNSALMALLQDSRFHPIPMVQPNREDTSDEVLDNVNHELPAFHVQGPISTGIGDECMGCSRGWHHYCPIIDRALPSVKWRAKLQPSQASYTATRIGLGLNYEQDRNCHYNGSDMLYYLTNPSKRMDSTMTIIEKIISIGALDQFNHSTPATMSLNDNSPEGEDQSVDIEARICRNCKSIVRRKDGCVKCSRLKLLKEEASKGLMDAKLPSVQTIMLARDGSLEYDFPDDNIVDERIETLMSKSEWNLNAILPRYDTDDRVIDFDSLSDSIDEFKDHLKPPDSVVTHGRRSMHTLISTSRRLANAANALSEDNDFSSEHYKDQSIELQKKCLFVAIHEILIGLLRRDPMKLFAKPVPIDVNGYHDIISDPIDFGLIKQKVFKREYKSLRAFASDVELLCLNSQTFNPPGSIYDETAKEIHIALNQMTKRAFDWISAVKNAHASFYSRKGKLFGIDSQNQNKDPFYFLRKSWYGSIDLLDEYDERTRSYTPSTFIRTKENELAYYAAVALRRSAVAADSSVATAIEFRPLMYPCVRRSADADEELRQLSDMEVLKGADPSCLLSPSSSKEMRLLDLVREIQKRRSERKVTPDSLCSRCVPKDRHDQSKIARYADIKCSDMNRRKRKRQIIDRMHVDESRLSHSNGSASMNTSHLDALSNGISFTRLNGSDIQGLGLYAERRFKKNDIVAEYMGEYIYNPVADKREKIYEDNRIQDYQFRVSYSMVIDATKNGGFARYINHSCDPNCFTKIISGETSNEQMKRVIVIAQRDITPGEEITYDYQFPIELDLSQRIPCGCGAEKCRGFMNWDINDFLEP